MVIKTKRNVLVVLVVFGIIFSGISVDSHNLKADDMKVKFRGVILGFDDDTDIDGEGSYLIKVTEILSGTAIEVGWEVRVQFFVHCDAHVSWELDLGDKVEIYGERAEMYIWPPIINVCAYYEYIKKIGDGGKLEIDMRIDKGCGATYEIGDPMKIYFEVNKACHITLRVTTSQGTKTNISNKYASTAGTYAIEGTVGDPTGEHKLTIYAKDSYGNTAQDTCSFYVESQDPCKNKNCDQYDGYVGEKYCKNGDVYRKYRDYYCEDGECEYEEEERKIEDCDYGCESGGCKPKLTTPPPTTQPPTTSPPTTSPPTTAAPTTSPPTTQPPTDLDKEIALKRAEAYEAIYKELDTETIAEKDIQELIDWCEEQKEKAMGSTSDLDALQYMFELTFDINSLLKNAEAKCERILIMIRENDQIDVIQENIKDLRQYAIQGDRTKEKNKINDTISKIKSLKEDIAIKETEIEEYERTLPITEIKEGETKEIGVIDFKSFMNIESIIIEVQQTYKNPFWKFWLSDPEYGLCLSISGDMICGWGPDHEVKGGDTIIDYFFKTKDGLIFKGGPIAPHIQWRMKHQYASSAKLKIKCKEIGGDGFLGESPTSTTLVSIKIKIVEKSEDFSKEGKELLNSILDAIIDQLTELKETI